jgi:spore maturation protein CgeB
MSGSAILYIGPDSGTSRHRARALRRLGNEVFVIDPQEFLPNNRFVNAWNWHTGSLFLEGFIRRKVLANIPRRNFDLVFVDGGEFVGRPLTLELQKRHGKVVNYNADDPFGQRDGRKWRLYLRSVPVYDLIVVVRDNNVPEAFAVGARDVLRVHRSADEVAHSPRRISADDRLKWASDVAFVGTWMPERGPFMARLMELGVPLAIYGDQWHKAAEWPVLRSAWRGGGLYVDDEYAKAIQCAKVNLGLLSKGNRDQTTSRTFEILSLGGVFCAERTPEHLELYEENQEAVFWSDAEECARKCKDLLANDERRRDLGMKARRRCLQNGTMNQKVVAQIVDRAKSPERISRSPAAGYELMNVEN